MFFKRLIAAWLAFRDYKPPHPMSSTTSVSVSTPLGTYITPRYNDPRPAIRAVLKLAETRSLRTTADNENIAQSLLKLMGKPVGVREGTDNLIPGIDFQVVSAGGYIDDRIFETANLYLAAIDEVAKNNTNWPEFQPPARGFGTRC